MKSFRPDILQLAAIVEESNDAIISTTLDTVVLTWNAAAERLYGYDSAEMIGHSSTLLFPPMNVWEEKDILRKVARGEIIENYEAERIKNDGQRIYVSITLSPITNQQGVVVGVSSIARDITERKRAEAERLLVASMVDSSEDAIIGKTVDGIITSWNKGAERLYGYTAKEAVGRPISMLMPPERADDFPVLMDRIRQGQRVERYETVRQRKDGTRLEVSLTVSPIRDGNGLIIGASAIARDITEQKHAELALRSSEQQFRRLIDTAPGAILLIDESGRIVLLNERVETMFGYARDELLGLPVEVLLPEEFRKGHLSYRTTFFTHPSARPMGIGRDLSGLRKDGTEFPVEVGLSHLQSETGVLALAFVTDITERLRAEEERTQLLIREQAARAETERIRLEERNRISMELHDGIIQSVYAVGMSLELARASLVADSQLNDVLVRAIQTQNQIIDDLRRYIRDLKADVDMSEVFKRECQDLAIRFRDSSSTALDLDVPETLTYFVQEYLHAVIQLLREGLSNIARHANASEVKVVLRESPSQITLHISDNGVGFDLEKVEFGSGLQNMRQRVEQLGGTYDIVSAPQRGTTLEITFPVPYNARRNRT